MFRRIDMARFLFVTQGHHRINARRAVGRDKTRGERATNANKTAMTANVNGSFGPTA
jgi:uncharacterized protein (DUF1015 family)